MAGRPRAGALLQRDERGDELGFEPFADQWACGELPPRRSNRELAGGGLRHQGRGQTGRVVHEVVRRSDAQRMPRPLPSAARSG